MKTKITCPAAAVILILILTISLAQATLLDLTPGGFRSGEPLPRRVAEWFDKIYGVSIVYAGNAHIDGNTVTWEDMPINGSNVNLTAMGITDLLSWQLPDIQLKYILTGYYDFNTSVLTANLYRLTPRDYHFGFGSVNVDGLNPVTGIAFYSAVTLDRGVAVPMRPKTESEIWKMLYEQTVKNK